MTSVNKTIICCVVAALFTLSCGVIVAVAKGPVTVWIIPFENSNQDVSFDNFKEAIPELLEVFFSHTSGYAVIDRNHTDTVLAEQSLTLEGLVSDEKRQKIGRLLGATVMISGGFVKQGENLIINAHAYDIESGRLLASREINSKGYDIVELVKNLYGCLVEDLQKALPVPGGYQIDETPISNLHFMKGLSFYYSAHYNQAIGEFIQASSDEKLYAIARFWMANCYLVKEEYAHAYIELKRLIQKGPQDIDESEIETKLNLCLKHLSPDEIQSYNQIISP